MRLLIFGLVLFVTIPELAFGGAPMDIGSRLELFLDDYLIEEMNGVTLQLHEPVRRETVITFDAPWEGDSSAYVTVFKDGQRYRMYYRGSGNEGKSSNEVTCTAESVDGIHWTRPSVKIFDFNGSKDNNIVWIGKGAHAFSPFKDSNPSAREEELYKAVGPGSGNGKSALYAFVSPDGYHWRALKKDPIITDGTFDSHNVVFWDAERKEYVCYYRDFHAGIRDIKRAVSKDFSNWSKGEWLDWGDAPQEHLYTNAIIPYFRAPHIYVGFPKRFVPGRKAISTHLEPGVSDGLFMSSRDGLHFHRWREAFLRPGPDPENWTDRNIMAAWGLLQLDPREICVYYSQHYRHPTNGLVRVALRTDGFVSVHAGASRGEMITKPLVFSGKELVINFSTSAAGGIRVEIQDSNGSPVRGFSLEECSVIFGDEIERVVSWNGRTDVSGLAGKPVRLKFELADADLYSIRFRE